MRFLHILKYWFKKVHPSLEFFRDNGKTNLKQAREHGYVCKCSTHNYLLQILYDFEVLSVEILCAACPATNSPSWGENHIFLWNGKCHVLNTRLWDRSNILIQGAIKIDGMYYGTKIRSIQGYINFWFMLCIFLANSLIFLI